MNWHALVGNDGVVHDPLSDCTFTTQAEFKAGLKGHLLDISNGLEGIQKAQAQNKLISGARDLDDLGTDWVVVKLKTAPAHVIPFKVPSSLALHGCLSAEPETCQRLIGISAHDHQVPGVGDSAIGQSVVQTFNLYGTKPSSGSNETPTRLYTNRSSLRGTSGGLNFFANRDGIAVRVDDQIVPVGMAANSPVDEKYPHAHYDSANGISTGLIAFDGRLGSAIRKLAGERQISAGPVETTTDHGTGL